jgi:hypothetical protein
MGFVMTLFKKIYDSRFLSGFKTYLNNNFLIRDRKTIKFIGWDMITDHAFPWDDHHQWENFRKSCEDIKKDFEFGPEIGYNAGNIDTLKWRHWFVAFSAGYALEFIKTSGNDKQSPFNFVECGVADGMTSYFLLKELKQKQVNYSLHLYDAWGAMREEYLAPSEMGHVGSYKNLNFERTKRNLSAISSHIVFHKGFIPDSLKVDPPSPDNLIVYLHIDLNSSYPTLAALEFFYDKMVQGGVILFDDYGWTGYEDTKEAIDKFFSTKSGILLKMPTGQALYLINKQIH